LVVMIRKVVSSIRMISGLVRRIQLEEELDAVGKFYIILCYCDPGNEMGVLESFAGYRISRITVRHNFKRSAKVFALVVQVCLSY
jgi:hypothetical protein